MRFTERSSEFSQYTYTHLLRPFSKWRKIEWRCTLMARRVVTTRVSTCGITKMFVCLFVCFFILHTAVTDSVPPDLSLGSRVD
jgi:hypothetical protein